MSIKNQQQKTQGKIDTQKYVYQEKKRRGKIDPQKYVYQEKKNQNRHQEIRLSGVPPIMPIKTKK